MAAVKHFTIIQGYPLDFKNFDRLSLLIRGIKRAEGKKFSLPKRRPITPNLLHTIHDNLFINSYRVYEDKLMLWAALLTAFFGFLRVSEYTSSHKTKFDPSVTLLFEDISFDGDFVNINIKGSKTDPFRHGITLRLAANGTTLCPVSALKEIYAKTPY